MSRILWIFTAMTISCLNYYCQEIYCALSIFEYLVLWILSSLKIFCLNISNWNGGSSSLFVHWKFITLKFINCFLRMPSACSMTYLYCSCLKYYLFEIIALEYPVLKISFASGENLFCLLSCTQSFLSKKYFQQISLFFSIRIFFARNIFCLDYFQQIICCALNICFF